MKLAKMTESGVMCTSAVLDSRRNQEFQQQQKHHVCISINSRLFLKDLIRDLRLDLNQTHLKVVCIVKQYLKFFGNTFGLRAAKNENITIKVPL